MFGDRFCGLPVGGGFGEFRKLVEGLVVEVDQVRSRVWMSEDTGEAGWCIRMEQDACISEDGEKVTCCSHCVNGIVRKLKCSEGCKAVN